MSTQHDSLMRRFEQHKPKNEKSKIDDKNIYESMAMVADYLEERFSGQLDDFIITFDKSIKIS